ncbi:lipoprotein-anchoring transpeptidase ErfK/SrfK [Mycobacterium frederiksbergense]|uniref:Lipoprotein-anchoring transpeptidase ErfK/SrfK n=1 Tax=Mycolicibacterium frederiksbergense TaxID=117567 RepID=A0ABT6L8V2_9MYCO|nr:lipoprotein-anchoring transpeptidase ErfK/SrfK [Mycolicibacterium frederiksbergense]
MPIRLPQKRPAPIQSALGLALVATITAGAATAPKPLPPTTSAVVTASPTLATSSSDTTQTRVSFTATSGAKLVDGGTYGVGTVIVASFDEPVTDRATAQKQLSVKTVPAVDGSWYWMDSKHAHWRPKSYYSPGTQVVATSNANGQEDSRVSFRIGDSHVSIADDATKQISVYRNGELVRTIPTSMGMGGSENVAGKTISFWTQPGVYTVMDKAKSVVMDSSTYGLPIESQLGYKLTVNNAVRLSNNGIYVHQLDSTVWAQGNTNTSHGCLNVSADHGRWFYEFSQPGDVFEVRNTGGDPLPIWQNGDWSVPWDQWLKGSALR